MWFLLIACSGQVPDTAPETPTEVDWNRGRVRSAEVWSAQRGLELRRAIVHLHSAWSHDACDGQPLIDGVPDAACVSDLRSALCETAIDAAFLTDHPTHAADASWEELFHPSEGDEALVVAGAHVASRIHCEGGHEVTWLPGTEDELSWLALDRHIGDSPEESAELYNSDNPETVAVGRAAGGLAFMAHSEGKDPDYLAGLHEAGLGVMEVFNLHAMFAPDIRANDLGLDPTGWVTGIAPFTKPDATGEPDLLFLGVLGRQDPSITRWVTLLQEGPITAVAGTDAHQNVLNLELRDGERLDSYRRMLRWFTNVLLVESDTPEHYEAALRSGRNWLVFDLIGTPDRLDLHLVDAGGAVHEVGSTVSGGGELVVVCPELHASSPQGLERPELAVRVYRNEVVVAESCGTFDATEPGAWRVEFDLKPSHLRRFFGEAPEEMMTHYPWLVSNAIRVVP